MTQGNPPSTALTLQYSLRASRQSVRAPINDCGTHPDTIYRKVPRYLRDRVSYDYGCTACLKELYHRVSPGGIVQIDDYHLWQGCRNAVDEFFAERSRGPVYRSGKAIWFRKP